ncbi:hypothetical protein M8J75_008121 [Diaphorina citri]|nr:hypothetical protein M8J75_008121 [Diaphorina citri]
MGSGNITGDQSLENLWDLYDQPCFIEILALLNDKDKLKLHFLEYISVIMTKGRRRMKRQRTGEKKRKHKRRQRQVKLKADKEKVEDKKLPQVLSQT